MESIERILLFCIVKYKTSLQHLLFCFLMWRWEVRIGAAIYQHTDGRWEARCRKGRKPTDTVIGYYENHEYRNLETTKLFDFGDEKKHNN